MSEHRLFGIDLKHPIVLAPMAGGPSTAPLVAAVANAGGLGSFGAAYLAPAAIREAIRDVRARTDRPFAVNLFVPAEGPLDRAREAAARDLLAPYLGELGLAAPPIPVPDMPPFDEQLAVVLDERVAVLSVTMGIPSAEHVAALHARGIAFVGTATTTREARALEDAGADAIVAQGAEAGGHRGTFAAPFDRALVGTMALVPQIVDAVRVPVIASGGIMDGRGIVAALALGAVAAQLGTAFLACDEAGTGAAYRDALAASTDESTTVTRAFSGRAARGLANRFIDEMRPHEDALPPFPIQNGLTREMRNAATRAGKMDLVSMWAGQASRMVRRMPAAALVAELAREMAATRERLAR